MDMKYDRSKIYIKKNQKYRTNYIKMSSGEVKVGMVRVRKVEVLSKHTLDVYQDKV